ncbi:MAG: HAD family hydrolase [Anaerolineae bacterium]|nr:HAD family hydrolase [Anaerolineae bacterium]
MRQLECDAILFDLDGVLIDSTNCIVRHWQEWAAANGIDLAEIMRVMHGRPTVETMRLVAPHLPVETEARLFEAAEVLDTDGVKKIEGAARLLNSLPPDAWSIVTSGTRNVATTRIRHAGLPLPTILITANDVTQGKPSPEPCLLAAKRLGLAPDRCVVIEDSPAGISAAHAAGMQVIAIASTHAGYELNGAEAIAERLSDIQIMENNEAHRLIIRLRRSYRLDEIPKFC